MTKLEIEQAVADILEDAWYMHEFYADTATTRIVELIEQLLEEDRIKEIRKQKDI
jgi:hypothetical protein